MQNAELIPLRSSDDIIGEILKQGKKALSEAIPDDMETREVLAAVNRCTSALRIFGNASGLVGAYLGRHLSIVAARPEIYQAAGYDTLGEYERGEIAGKIGHGTLWNYRAISDQFSEILPIEEIPKLGSVNLLRAAKVCKKLNATTDQKQEILRRMRLSATGAEFKKYLEEESGLAIEGETDNVLFELYGTKPEIDELKEFLSDPRVEKLTGIRTHIGKILFLKQNLASNEDFIQAGEF